MNAIKALQALNQDGMTCPLCRMEVKTLYVTTRLRPSPDGFRTIVRCQNCYDIKLGE